MNRSCCNQCTVGCVLLYHRRIRCAEDRQKRVAEALDNGKGITVSSSIIFKSRGHFVSISSQLGQHNFTIFNRYHLKKRIVFQILVNSSLRFSEQNFSITQNEAGIWKQLFNSPQSFPHTDIPSEEGTKVIL